MKSNMDNAVEAIAILRRYEGRLDVLAAQSEFWSTSMLYRLLRGQQVEVEVHALADLKRADGIVLSQAPKPELEMGKTGLPMKNDEALDFPTLGDTVLDEDSGACGWCVFTMRGVEQNVESVARFVLESGSVIRVHNAGATDCICRMERDSDGDFVGKDGYGLVPVIRLPQGHRAWRLTRNWRK